MVVGGPAFGYLLRARTRADFGEATEEIDVADEVERFDFGVVVGAGRDWPTAQEAVLKLREGAYLAAEAHETEQDESRVSFAPKVTREDARIDWTLEAMEVSRLIRAYDPKPGAFSTRDGTALKVFGPRVAAESDNSAKPGEVIAATPELVVACGTGAIRISDVQPAGRSRMSAADWARGRGIAPGDLLGV
mgnify:CR=1 FL=1